MTREELIHYWRTVERRNAPQRVDSAGVTPRHLLVDSARLKLRILDPEVKVWKWQIRRRELGLLVAERKRYRLGHDRALAQLDEWIDVPHLR